MQQSSFITKCDRLLLQSASVITKRDRLLLQSGHVLQSVTDFITKCVRYYEVLQLTEWDHLHDET